MFQTTNITINHYKSIIHPPLYRYTTINHYKPTLISSRPRCILDAYWSSFLTRPGTTQRFGGENPHRSTGFTNDGCSLKNEIAQNPRGYHDDIFMILIICIYIYTYNYIYMFICIHIDISIISEPHFNIFQPR